MRIINQKRQKSSKSVEQSGENLKSHSVAATSTGDVSPTDASQPSAVNHKRSWLHRLKQRLINRSPTNKHEKQQHKSKTSKSPLRRRTNNLDSHQERDKFRTLPLTSSELNNKTQSQSDDKVRNQRPKFRLGPRTPEAMGEDGVDQASVSSTSVSQSTVGKSSVRMYGFIFQDGRLVEREFRRWPYFKQPKLTMRYKLCEPYASNYGQRFAKRVLLMKQNTGLKSSRYICEKPIFRLPRAMVNENKRRLLARHGLKTFKEPEPGTAYRMPMQINMLEGEQCKRYRGYEKEQFIRDTVERIGLERKPN